MNKRKSIEHCLSTLNLSLKNTKNIFFKVNNNEIETTVDKRVLNTPLH